MTKALDKLEAKRKALEAQIAAERKVAAARERRITGDKNEAVGAAVVAFAADNPDFNATLQKILADRVTHPRMRTLLNLPLLPQKEKP